MKFLNSDGLTTVWRKIKDNFLAKDNVEEFTPTGDYNPATKKYVDDKVGDISTLTTDDKTNLTNAVNEIVSVMGEKADKTDTYTKTEVDNLLSENAGNAGGTGSSANIKQNPDATEGDIVDTHLTVGYRALGANMLSGCLGGNLVTGGMTREIILNPETNEPYIDEDGNYIFEYKPQKGLPNIADGLNSAVIGGYNNKIDNMRGFSEGYDNVSNSVIIGGYNNNVYASESAVIGGHNNYVSIDGFDSFVLGGADNYIYSSNSVILGGHGNISYNGYNVIIGGTYSNADEYDDSLFVLGNGKSESNISNAFRVSKTGSVYGLSAFNSSGADYAEYFEWEDGNPDNEDRRGLFVTLDGEKIRLATSEDEYILGVISASPCLVGDSASEGWQGMYLKDVFGSYLTETVEIPAEIDEETGRELRLAYTTTQFVSNPDYDNTQKYVNRESRKEWAPVGFMGKLVVVDDGTCVANSYCKVGENGVATNSTEKSGYRVMARLDDTHIKVLVR